MRDPVVRRRWRTRSEEETVELGRRLAAALRPPLWVGLSGPMGAGKTRLAQGLAQGLGYQGRVRSPTFILENRYRGKVLILHQDLYRLDGGDESIEAGWAENRDAVVLVEWPERAEDLPDRRLRLTVSVVDDSTREIELEGGVDVLDDSTLPDETPSVS